jgi:DNA-binding LacI/PurR family transcriptional regulator
MPSEAPAAAAGVIGVVLPTVNTTYYTTLVTDMSSEASYYGWTVSVHTTDYTGSEEGALMALMAEGVDAVIIDPNGLTASAIQTLESDCLAAGLPCVMLLDEGETADGSVSTVSFDLVGAGADMAFKCALGNVYVVGGDSYSSETSGIEQGLFYDSSFGISGYSGIEVAGTAYASGQSAETLVENALLTNPDINTFICTDPDLADDVLSVLESASYSGNLLCYTYETTKDEMGSDSFSVYVTCEYFEMTDIASNAMTAVADQLEYGRGPQVYTIYSTNY